MLRLISFRNQQLMWPNAPQRKGYAAATPLHFV